MKYISLFAGIGGFDLALDKLGHECVYTNEWDKHAAKVYETRFNRPVDTRDIKTVSTEEIPEHDLLVGGFPCQAFSIAGKRLGFDDTRGTLFFEIARILKDKQPKYFILENVKGLISHNSGQTFRTIISTIAELGYDCQWNLYNSKDYGVPQNRERIYIVGHLRGISRPEVFSFRESNSNSDETSERINQLTNPPHSGQRVYGTDGIAPTVTTGKKVWISSLKFGQIQKVLGGLQKNASQTNGEISPTLTSAMGMGGGHIPVIIPENYSLRRLTEIECERLQGFPNDEKYSIIKICLDHQKNPVSVEIQNPKLQKYVGNVEKKDLKETVLSVGLNLTTKNQQTNKPVLTDVLISCEENGVEIHSQKKLLLNAKYVGKKNWSHPHIGVEDFVQLLVGLNTIVGKITNFGKGELPQNERCLTLQKIGKKQENQFGKEITPPADYVKNDLTTLKELLKFTTLDPLNTENLEQKFQILSLYVTHVITGYIPKEILNQNSFTIGIKTKVGHTYGISSTQRYKCLGNAVTVNVVYELARNL
jgi:DNA-cytosine methyltransferase